MAREVAPKGEGYDKKNAARKPHWWSGCTDRIDRVGLMTRQHVQYGGTAVLRSAPRRPFNRQAQRDDYGASCENTLQNRDEFHG